jgi:hypothetical protein
MNGRDLFPDYQPKTSPDTVYDYLRVPDSKVFKILNEINPPSLKNLKNILSYFNKYKIEVEKKPGGYKSGNIALGADLDQYYPSEEEILVSELGKSIKVIIELSSIQELEDIKEEEGISSQTLKFNEIRYRHVDAMGSGRFFYAEKNEQEIIISL